jgi:ABC-type dipeptide/oligopeptide/nickel transport system permease subunit
MAREAVEIAPAGIEPEQAHLERNPLSPTALAFRRLRRKKIALVAMIFIAIFYVAGITAPLLDLLDIIPPYNQQDLENAYQGPSWSHPFGTDQVGRDQLSRMIWASQTTVIVTVATLITGGLILTVGLGLLSGYVGGWVDTAIMRVGDVLISLPSFLMLVLINSTMKSQVRAVGGEIEEFTGISGIVRSGAADYILIFGVLSLFGWVGGARIIRSQILALRETEFVLAAHSLGAATHRILTRHLLPNISNYVIVSMSLSLGAIAGAEIGLTWLGIGIQPPRPSYGALIYAGSGIRTIQTYWWLMFFPSAIVAGLIFAFNLLGDALTDVFTPKAR